MNPAATRVSGLEIDEGFIFRWKYGELGDFGNALMKAAIHADKGNLSRLAQGFGVEIRALRRYWAEEGWWQSVQAKAKSLGLKRCPPTQKTIYRER